MKKLTTLSSRLDIATTHDIVVCKERPGEVCFFSDDDTAPGLRELFIPANEASLFRDLFVQICRNIDKNPDGSEQIHHVNTAGEVMVGPSELIIKRKMNRFHTVFHFAAYDKPDERYSSWSQVKHAVKFIAEVFTESVRLKAGKGDFAKLQREFELFDDSVSALTKGTTLDFKIKYFMGEDDGHARWEGIFRCLYGTISGQKHGHTMLRISDLVGEHSSYNREVPGLLSRTLKKIQKEGKHDESYRQSVDEIPYVLTSVFGYTGIRCPEMFQFTICSASHAGTEHLSVRTHVDNIPGLIEILDEL